MGRNLKGDPDDSLSFIIARLSVAVDAIELSEMNSFDFSIKSPSRNLTLLVGVCKIDGRRLLILVFFVVFAIACRLYLS